MKKRILFLIYLTTIPTIIFCQTVTFTQSTTLIPNPEKGFYHQIETAQQVANFSALDVNDMIALRAGHTVNGTSFMPPVTLVLRLYYINDFINAAFTTTYLNNIRNDMTAARSRRDFKSRRQFYP